VVLLRRTVGDSPGVAPEKGRPAPLSYQLRTTRERPSADCCGHAIAYMLYAIAKTYCLLLAGSAGRVVGLAGEELVPPAGRGGGGGAGD